MATSLDYKYIGTLIKSAIAGSSDAFAEFYAATYQRQYHFAYNYLKDPYLAQDALQETYIHAYKNLTQLKDPTLVIAWLNQINFRICYNLQQKQRKYNNEMIDLDYEPIDLRHLEQPSPEDEIVRSDTKEYILRQIMTLPFTESQCIFLRHYQNMTIKEIAKQLDISVSSVKRYLRSGMERLSKVLQ